MKFLKYILSFYSFLPFYKGFLALAFALFICCSVGISQNLVPNPSFELGPNETSEDWANRVDTNCNILGFIGGPTFWTVTNSSPDRLYEGDIPCNWDNDTAAFGSAYIVMGGSISSSEKGKTTLVSPLIADSAYYLSYFAKVETFRTPILFTPTRIAFDFYNGDIIFSPIISDTTQWVRYDTIFTASSSATEMEVMCASPSFSAFKLDSITLQKVTITSIRDYHQKNQISIYPNPTDDYINVQNNFNTPFDVAVYNSIGQLLYKKQNISSNNLQIDISGYNSGLLFIKIESNKQSIIYKLFKS